MATQVNDLLRYNSATGEIQIWFMQGEHLARRATVVDKEGRSVRIGPPWSIAAAGDLNGDGSADIVWHHSTSGETQVWFMNRERIAGRSTVLDEHGQAIFIGPPWGIVGAGNMNGSANGDIVWYNSATGEIQIWLMERERIVGRPLVSDEKGKAVRIGPPWSIAGVGDMNGDGKADIVWHNSETGETEIWFMAREVIAGRATVLDEQSQPIFIKLPWRIAGAADMNGNGQGDIVWHNSATGETQIWFLKGRQIDKRRTVIDDSAASALIAPPWVIAAVGEFDKRVIIDEP